MKEVEIRIRENFSAGRDSGSGLCVFGGEKKLISLYGGFLDADRLRPWREDTLVGMGSGTKGIVVACVLHAMQEAGADLDSIISDFWPEFAQGGKRAMTLGQLLSHRSGLCAPNDITLGIELWIGLPESENARVAATCAPPRGMLVDSDLLFARAFADPDSLVHRAFTRPANLPGGLTEWNTPRMWAAGLPSVGGMASAQALAKFYAMLANGGTQNGSTYFKRQTLDWMSTRLTQGFDHILQCDMAFSAGFMMDPLDKNGQKTRFLFGKSVSAFGHIGLGGSLGFADPERGIGFAYLMSHWEAGVLPRKRCTGLVDAIYNAD